jgi:hypothetical protein
MTKAAASVFYRPAGVNSREAWSRTSAFFEERLDAPKAV